MSMEYIRKYYGVPAKRGGRVAAIGKTGTICGTSGPHLRVRLDGETFARIFHPTWNMVYHEAAVAQKPRQNYST